MIDFKLGFKKAFGMSIITSIVFLAIGLFLLTKPDATISIVSLTIGILFIMIGTNRISKYIKNKNEYNFLKLDLTIGIISIVLGSILIYNNRAIVSILPFVLGIYFIVNSITKIQYAIELKKYNTNKWISALVPAIMTLIIGFVFVVNPFKGAKIITQIIGLFIVLYSLTDIINYFLLKRNFDKIVTVIEE
ncbi:MAG: DUF308 domain-containing protein [Bacilli bacterium]|nr:DUF308 domain-containing protein [Bacilli bacterium]